MEISATPRSHVARKGGLHLLYNIIATTDLAIRMQQNVYTCCNLSGAYCCYHFGATIYIECVQNSNNASRTRERVLFLIYLFD